MKKANQLVSETSPYLLQHAWNPVNWYPWGPVALDLANKENKLILVSIGYSACHWCHVMEHESFEDKEVAAIMNEHFICIKVDREERPDIDAIYMIAVQLITGSGGWPLNCFALPGGKPFYGGTYFRKNDWLHILQTIAVAWRAEPEKITRYAEDLSNGIVRQEEINLGSMGHLFTTTEIFSVVNRLINYYDLDDGGTKGTPKFPLPVHYEFLLHFWWSQKYQPAIEITSLTLDKMGQGGIYDHLGGGFARYSVDSLWHVPHFEKMLYDNAQLVSLYSKAYQLTGKKHYKEIATETIAFVLRDLTSPEGAFYSAFDADSEGEEGKFYTWTQDEIDHHLGQDSILVKKFFGVTQNGNWEKTNILHQKNSLDEFARAEEMESMEVEALIHKSKEKLFKEREKRVKPLLDDKVIAAWNGLMIIALCDAANATGIEEYDKAAIRAAEFLRTNLKRDDGSLLRTYKNNTGRISGFLDDYAFVIEAFIKVYEISFDENFILVAQQLLEYALEHFYSEEKGLFWYTSDLDEELITRTIETADSVIPSSNSVMAFNLFRLGGFFGRTDYISLSEKMGKCMRELTERSPVNYMNWLRFYLTLAEPHFELAVTGPGAFNKARQFKRIYHPSVVIAASERESSLPLLKGRWHDSKCRYFVCRNHVCEFPVEDPMDAMIMLGQKM